jgi:4-diphosphocytidyl-2-C-methyl-D-erythritol kinase
MVVFPRAKINVGLNITGKRSDGYHNIETLFIPVGLCDALEFVGAPPGVVADELIVTGLVTDCNPADNLVVRALNLIRTRCTVPPLRMHLHKAIPPGSGLGGGSSDASAMLVALNKFFSLGIDDAILQEMALTIGSDCPVFIAGTPVLASGRGEIFSPAPALPSGLTLVIVHEGIHISTAEAYGNCHPRKPDYRLSELIAEPPERWKETIKNDFEDYAFSKHPILAEIKESMYRAGALYSSMSGSGSAVYGLFTEEPGQYDRIKGNIIFKGPL